jgi:TetR/AcrR family transcriptional regulator, transcriptional repressor of aconitase
MPGRPIPSQDHEPNSTRDRILTAAGRLFAERGYGNVSMPAIAKASGITAGAIYRHFESKEDLFFQAVAQRSLEAQEAAATPAFDGGLPHVAAKYATARLKLIRQLAVEVHSASVHHPKVRRLLNRSLDHNIEQITASIAEDQARGKIDPALNPDLLARTVMVFIMGLMHMETLLPQQIGDERWFKFIEERVAAMLGMSDFRRGTGL